MIDDVTNGPADGLDDYARGFQVGRRMAARPAPPAPAPAAQDPMSLLATLPPDHQQETLRRLQVIAGLARAIGAATSDPLERARLAQHVAQMHPDLGIRPEQLTPEVMTDENLAQMQALAGAPPQPTTPPPATHAARGFTILGVE